jgi:membrane peptidoglycan carboxypeptidase
MSAPLPPPSAPRRSPHVAASLARLALFLVVSMLAGVVVAGTALPFVGGVGVTARSAFESYESLPSQLITPPLPQRSLILASDGSLLATIYEQNRIEVPISKIAPVMQQAIVAVEDGRFYEHRGVDPRGLIRALVGNAGSGNVTQGGSTLTQQYVKNVFVNSASTPEEAAAARGRNLTRKLKEMRYALALERQLTKDQILERYLNIAYFGAGAYGVEAAARRYFSTSASKLTLVQAATLAGAVQQPVAYDPTRNPRSSQKRRIQVLNRMAELGYITTAVAKTTGAIPTQKFLKPSSTHNGCTTSYAPFFCDYVYRILKNDGAFGKTPADREALLRKGGLVIRTTLDPATQRAAQASVDEHIPRADPSKKVAAISMVRPSTGEIVAMAENRSWGTSGKGATTYNFNVGTKFGGSLGAQAGSTFKAFTMAAAFEQNLSPYDYIVSPQVNTFSDFKACDTGAPFPPVTIHNSTGAGTFNMLQGAAYSINTYFMGLEEKTTQCAAADVAEKLGVAHGDGTPVNRVPNFTLGVDEVTPLTMATAYGVFANHGEYCQNVAITQVTDRTGKDLPVPQSNCTRVLDRPVADSVTSILSQVIDGPLPGRTGQAMSLGRDAAGKTGTTNSSASVWFVGFTPDLAAAVATYDPRGTAKRFAMQNLTIGGHYFSQVFGSTLPGPIWKQAMLAALANTVPTKFDLQTLDGLGVYIPPPPPVVCPGSTPAPTPTPGATLPPGATPAPTVCPSASPSSSPSASPSGSPTGKPSGSPSASPSPSSSLSPKPSGSPTPSPTKKP